jgi:hypothetical protein
LCGQAAYNLSIPFELRAVPRVLVVEEGVASRALVLRQLEIDDPTHAFGIDEGPIEHDVHWDPVAHTGQRVFAVGIAVPRIEQPAAARVSDRRRNRCEDLVGGVLGFLSGESQCRKLAHYAGAARREAFWRPAVDAFVGALSKQSVRDDSDLSRRFTRPVELKHRLVGGCAARRNR